jgi:two-component system, NarL family, response regulator NreC
MFEKSGATSAPVLIADDEELVRLGVREVLRRLDSAWPVFECATAEEAVEALEERPRIAIVDQCLPGGLARKRGEGMTDVCRWLAGAGTRVIVYTESGGLALSRMFQRAGASAAVSKEQDVSTLARAIERVAAGQKFFPAATSEPGALTPREAEVIRLLASGLSNSEVAYECGTSVRTVESHRARLRKRIGADSVSAITRYAIDSGLIC